MVGIRPASPSDHIPPTGESLSRENYLEAWLKLL